MRIHLVAAARPNFMKIAPLWHEINKRNNFLEPIIVHTGQHYDPEMSDNFLRDFRLPQPDFLLGIGSGTHAFQTARALESYETLCIEDAPSLVVVVGDVNSTLACALAAKKLKIPVAHLEAGLRSGDRSMPEEINRLATDSISDWFWTPSPDAVDNLRREGVPEEKIVNVGNMMIDSYLLLETEISQNRLLEQLGLNDTAFVVVTAHRPSNVDSDENLTEFCSQIARLSQTIKVIFAVHPRTKDRLISTGLWTTINESDGLLLLPPQTYIDFMTLVTRSQLVITDSGGVQEETTYLDIPCMTLRENTERPITLSQGSNRLVRISEIFQQALVALSGNWSKSVSPPLWDGHAAPRVVDEIERLARLKLIS